MLSPAAPSPLLPSSRKFTTPEPPRGVMFTPTTSPVLGGTIPGDDIPELKELGVAEVFTPGAPVQSIIDFIRGAVPA